MQGRFNASFFHTPSSVIYQFWLSAMAKFVKEGSTTAPYADMAAPYVGFYVRLLGFSINNNAHSRRIKMYNAV